MTRLRHSRFLVRLLVWTLALGICVQASRLAIASPVASSELPDMVERATRGVVNVSSVSASNQMALGWADFLRSWGIPEERRQTSRGSGFVMDDEGYVVTNRHVIEGADQVFVTLSSRQDVKARVIGTDPKMDVALLQLLGKPEAGLTPLPWGNSEQVRVAETVVAIGNPFGLQNTVTVGVISAKNRAVGLGPLDNFLQTDAAINPGNSGGPLLNRKGEVIGINTFIFSRAQQSAGVGFAIPSNDAVRIIPELKRYGRVIRPWIGVLVERVTPALAAHYGLRRSSGVVVYKMVSRGPAGRAGVKLGDIIIEANGNPTRETLDLDRALSKLKPKDPLKLKLVRGSREQSIAITLEELPPSLIEESGNGIL